MRRELNDKREAALLKPAAVYLVAAKGLDSGIQVRQALAAHNIEDTGEEPVAEPSDSAHLRSSPATEPGAVDYRVCLERVQQCGDCFRRVFEVGVDHYDGATFAVRDAVPQTLAIAFVAVVTDGLHAARAQAVECAIRRAVVNENQGGPWTGERQAVDQFVNASRFVEDGNYDIHSLGRNHSLYSARTGRVRASHASQIEITASATVAIRNIAHAAINTGGAIHDGL
jgi:hypothetical protein